MAVNLHPNAIAAAKEALAKYLPAISVKNGCSIEPVSVLFAAYQAQEALPTDGKIRDQLISWVDDQPLVEFVLETLRRELDTNQDYTAGAALVPLTAVEGYSNVEETASRLIDSFLGLPFSYTLTCPLSVGLIPPLVFEGGALSAGAGAKIFLDDLIFKQSFPLFHENEHVNNRAQGGLGLLRIGTLEWEADVPYFQIAAEGFLGIYGGGNVAASAQDLLESFLGLGLATRMFSYEWKFENSQKSRDWVAHRETPSGWEFDARFRVADDTSEVIRHMTSFKFSNKYPEENRIPWLKHCMIQAHKIIESADSATIMLACKWFFDSFKKGDAALKYIRTMTAIEILFGGKIDLQKASLSEVMSNRLAYAVAKSSAERAEIIDNFRKIYGLRSSILHRGKHRLNFDERQVLTKLQSYCERAILSEAKLLAS